MFFCILTCYISIIPLWLFSFRIGKIPKRQLWSICDPVQQKGHDVGQVYSEIMSKTVCKKENKRKFTLCKTCIFKSITSIFMNLVSLESLLIHLFDNAQISIFSKVDIMSLLLYWVTYTMKCLAAQSPFPPPCILSPGEKQLVRLFPCTTAVTIQCAIRDRPPALDSCQMHMVVAQVMERLLGEQL